MPLTYTSGSALEYAQSIFGAGATVNSASQIGNSSQISMFGNGTSDAAGVAPANTGLLISTGTTSSFNNNNTTNDQLSGTIGGPGDTQLEATVGASGSQDAAGLIINFTASQTGTITVPLTFLTEEYPEYYQGGYSDSAAVYLNGTLVPILGQSGGYFNIDSMENGAFLNNGNTGAELTYPTDFNAIKTGTITLDVVAGETYDLKIVIADFGDGGYDSALMIGANAFLCFSRGTMIETVEDLVAIEALRAGDIVVTKDNGPQEIRWIGSKLLDSGVLGNHTKLRPIRIQAGALGNNTPAADRLCCTKELMAGFPLSPDRSIPRPL
ncbi:Hint domain-containing protein [Paracoccus aminovorans]|uniref:Hint domain-containing protein n=1 Tax=Paracoccus aminovorans TaxID=34004 RepID=A0A1I3ETJ5_9RHOB|nr:choice-of-anchor L domain-containing protein [Paracoccus aminovorans]CQR84576.1 hypothetical protein JCM7685_pAMV3p0631 [Paracoccus aminovorans]SFI01941.1 Hint domain-containing protein [Paracoccus aminovorans]